jgi:hypothetical protein
MVSALVASRWTTASTIASPPNQKRPIWRRCTVLSFSQCRSEPTCGVGEGAGRRGAPGVRVLVVLCWSRHGRSPCISMGALAPGSPLLVFLCMFVYWASRGGTCLERVTQRGAGQHARCQDVPQLLVHDILVGGTPEDDVRQLLAGQGQGVAVTARTAGP